MQKSFIGRNQDNSISCARLLSIPVLVPWVGKNFDFLGFYFVS